MSNKSHPSFGNGKICYIELPSRDLLESGSFYNLVFQWETRKRDDGSIAFDDGVGEVCGTWRTDRKPTAEIGILIHIMVDDIEETMQKIKAHGGTIVQPVGMEAPEITARFLDPTGNLLGLYQHNTRP